MSNKGIAGLVLLIAGLIGAIICGITISNDTSGLIGYNYKQPWTAHETTMIILSILCVILIIVGIIMLVTGKKKQD